MLVVLRVAIADPEAVDAVERWLHGFRPLIQTDRRFALQAHALQLRERKQHLESVGLTLQRELVLRLGVDPTLLELEGLALELMHTIEIRRCLCQPAKGRVGEVSCHEAEIGRTSTLRDRFWRLDSAL